MESEEIEQLKKTVFEDSKEKVDTANEEDAIYVMSESEGWRVMMKKANKTLAALLEPMDSNDVSAEANLILIGANSLANGKAIKVLREFVSQAESVRNARRQMESIKKAEESEPEA